MNELDLSRYQEAQSIVNKVMPLDNIKNTSLLEAIDSGEGNCIAAAIALGVACYMLGDQAPAWLVKAKKHGHFWLYKPDDNVGVDKWSITPGFAKISDLNNISELDKVRVPKYLQIGVLIQSGLAGAWPLTIMDKHIEAINEGLHLAPSGKRTVGVRISCNLAFGTSTNFSLAYTLDVALKLWNKGF